MIEWLLQPWVIEAVGTISLAMLLVWLLSKMFNFSDKE
jgi:hypothetical protein